jgi:1-acyl-sn-glycerol-3-phosphate acyltransferase
MKIAWFYPLVRLSAHIMFAFTRVKVTGRENFPRTGALLVCSNHLSSADPPLLGLHLPRIPVYFLAKKELFKSRIFGGILKGSGAIPLNRIGVSGGSLKMSHAVLGKGGALVIFPEGKRNPEGKLSAALPGAAYLAAAAGVPILPVGITGTEKISGKWWFLKRQKVNINIGRPFYLSTDDEKPIKENLGVYGDQIMTAIAELLPPEYRGIYGEVT